MTSVVVTDLADDVFYARILVDIDGRHVEIDSRPSDAIALAVRVKAPIFVEEKVLDKAGVSLRTEGEEKGLTRGTDEEEVKKLSAFRDFINTLNLDDLGRHEGGQKKPSD